MSSGSVRQVLSRAGRFRSGVRRAVSAGRRQSARRADGFARRGGGRSTYALGIDEDQEVGRYAEYNERAAEVGDYFDTPEAEKGFNPHKDDDDVSMTSSDAELSVDTGSETVDAESVTRSTWTVQHRRWSVT